MGYERGEKKEKKKDEQRFLRDQGGNTQKKKKRGSVAAKIVQENLLRNSLGCTFFFVAKIGQHIHLKSNQLLL